MTLTQDRRAALIGGCPLFRGLDDTGLGAIAAASIEVDFPAERVIARAGRDRHRLLHHRRGHGPRRSATGTTVARLGPGEFFGELSRARRRRRASPRSPPRSRRRCLALASWDFERVLREEPGVALAVLRVVAGRLREVDGDHRT